MVQEHVDEGSHHIGVAGLFAREEQTHRVAGIRAERQRVDVCARVEERPRDVGAIGRQRRPRAIEAAAIGVSSHVVQQRRAGEVVERRVEIGACVHQRRVCSEQAAQARDISGIHRVDGLVETRMRAKRPQSIRQVDMLFELRPGIEAILACQDQLRVGERER